MRKFMTMLVGVAALCGSVALAQTTPAPVTPPAGAGTEDHVMRGRQDAAFFHTWIHRALVEGKNDAATLQLMTKALTDRTTMLQAETDQVAKLQALVTAIQGGSEDAIKTARESLKTSHEAVAAAARIFSDDVKAVREHVRTMPRPAGHNERGGGPLPKRGTAPSAAPAAPSN